MRVIMMLNDGEALRCDCCGAMEHGTAHLNIDEEDESVEAVYCATCNPHSSSTTTKRDE